MPPPTGSAATLRHRRRPGYARRDRVDRAQRKSQWESALASRDIIGQAEGMLMERYRLDAIRAFDLLSRQSQKANTKPIPNWPIARQLVEHDHPAP